MSLQAMVKAIKAKGLTPTEKLVLIRVGKCSQARDLDNFAKATIDLLVHCGVIRTDNLTMVHSVTAVRAFGDVPEGMVSVSVEFVTHIAESEKAA